MRKILKPLREMHSPRMGNDHDKPGSYHLASKVTYNIVDPGGELEFSQFVTGYGKITSSKIVAFVSEGVFDSSASIHRGGLSEKEIGILRFGDEDKKIDISGLLISINGVEIDGWGGNTLYFDLTDDACPNIATEFVLGSAPFYYKLKLNDAVLAGEYSIDFYFTYFNGEKWVCSKESVKFKVRSFLERHAAKLSWYGIGASLSGLILGILKLFGGG